VETAGLLFDHFKVQEIDLVGAGVVTHGPNGVTPKWRPAESKLKNDSESCEESRLLFDGSPFALDSF
jgi:hypothetical protein